MVTAETANVAALKNRARLTWPCGSRVKYGDAVPSARLAQASITNSSAATGAVP